MQSGFLQADRPSDTASYRCEIVQGEVGRDKDFSLTRSRVRQCELLDGTDTWDVGQAGSLTRRLRMCGVRLLLSQNAVMTRRYG